MHPPTRESPPELDLGAGRGPSWLDAAVGDNLAELIAIRREVHAHPELAHTESGTSALILRTLAGWGISGKLLPGGTGVVAEIGPKGAPVGAPGAGAVRADAAAVGTEPVRTIALRADIDALPILEATGLPFTSTVPGMSHACGHDVHLTVLLGVARALTLAPQLTGRIRLIFQPAEEVMPGGAIEAVAAGVLDGVERIFALHCDPRLVVGRVGLKPGAITSTADLIELTLQGLGGHTARPHLTADLIYALGLVITGLPGLLSRRMDPRTVPVLVWGAVAAGTAGNAIPESGSLKGTLRLMERSGWDQAEGLVAELIDDLLAPTTAKFILNYIRGVPPVENDPACTELLRAGVLASLGPDGVAVALQSTGAEDFGVMTNLVPGALARLGVWDGAGPQVDLHSSTFKADERAIAVGVRLMVNTALAALDS